LALPKLAPDTIGRSRVIRWIVDHADFPLRFLAAPAGSGKTTALVSYAKLTRRRVVFLTVGPQTQPDDVYAAVAQTFGLERAPSLAAFLVQLGRLGRCEILVDDADRAAPPVQDVLRRVVVEAPENVTFIYASRSRELVDTTRLVTLGLATLFGGDRLAFTVDEATRFVEASGAPVVDERDIARLVDDADGWAFAVCGAIRHAVSMGRTLATALSAWRGDEARTIASFIDDVLVNEEPELVQVARRALDGDVSADILLERVEARGLFVRWSHGAFHPYRALARLGRTALPAALPRPALPQLTVRLFGSIDVRIDGQRIEWIRRRDAQLLAFLALQPLGRATRGTILHAFWPSGDRSLASQSLRSACSTLRRALAAVVGHEALPEYVTFGEEIVLNLDLFTIDARRVRAHIADAAAALQDGDHDLARDHADAAQRLARAPFLGGDVPAALQDAARTLDDELVALRRSGSAYALDLPAAI
jgi:hypothetical protein